MRAIFLREKRCVFWLVTYLCACSAVVWIYYLLQVHFRRGLVLSDNIIICEPYVKCGNEAQFNADLKNEPQKAGMIEFKINRREEYENNRSLSLRASGYDFEENWVLDYIPLHFPNVRADKIVNPHNFKILNRPKKSCTSGQVDLIVCVFCRPGESKQRMILRGSRKYFFDDPKNRAKMVFVVGALQGATAGQILTEINEEALMYNDILQEDFIDAYTNLTYKSVSILKWITHFCPSTTYAVKTDCDVDLPLPNLLKALRKQTEAGRDEFIIGRIRQELGSIVIRNPKSKYFVPYEMFARKHYPLFCYGGAYGFTNKTAFKMYETSLMMPFFYLEDVYTTGLISEFANITLIEDSLFNYKH